MTREVAIKAYNRMMDYVTAVDSMKAELMKSYMDEEMKEALLNAFEKVEFEDLDRETKRFFLDDSEWEVELALLIDDAKKYSAFGKIYADCLAEVMDD